MPEIKLEHVTKRWAKFYAVEDLNLTIENNAFVTLLGPSGCGKTTTLRMIAGLETPTSGRITIGDKVVFDSDLGINVPANKRKVGFLFQNYALWPNMTVYQNISFGLSNVKEALPKIDFDAKNAARLAEILKTPADVVSVLDECRDKDGKLEEKKAILKLIDAFTLSQYTAKKLFDYHLETKSDCASEIAALTAKVETAKKAAQDAGFTLDDEFRYTKDGEIVTQVRKLTKEEIDLSVRRVSRIVKIGMFMDRYPAELSGGQQQRVACQNPRSGSYGFVHGRAAFEPRRKAETRNALRAAASACRDRLHLRLCHPRSDGGNDSCHADLPDRQRRSAAV